MVNNNLLLKFCGRMNDRIREDFDGVVCIDGEEGIGKSVLAQWIAILTDKNYDMIKQCLFQPKVEDVRNSIGTLPRYSVVVSDEAIRILYKMRRFDKLQIYLNTIYALCRERNLVTILCIPRYTDLNEYFREHRVKFWIHVFDRGRALLFVRRKCPFSKDIWDFKGSEQRFNRSIKGNDMASMSNDEINKVMKHINSSFMGVIEFDDLPEETKVKYKELKAQYQFQDLESEFGIEDSGFKKYFITLAYILNKKLNVPMGQIASWLGCSDRNIRTHIYSMPSITKQVIEDATKDLNISNLKTKKISKDSDYLT